MKFQVPQFIEVEDKIFGPLTFRQFVYLAGSAGLVFILYTFMPLIFAILISAPVIALAVALAFYKINNRPFIRVLEAAFNYTRSSKLYIWKKEPNTKKQAKKVKAADKITEPQILVPKLSESKLKDLAWSLDIQESLYTGRQNKELRSMKQEVRIKK